MPDLIEKSGDLFALTTTEPKTILVHACNARGAWGAGIALAFKQHYPLAYKSYHTHCCPSQATLKKHGHPTLSTYQKTLVGTALLIPSSSPSSRSTNLDPNHRADRTIKSGDNNNKNKPANNKTKKRKPSNEKTDPTENGGDEEEDIHPKENTEKQICVGCLITSNAYGTGKDSPGAILAATRSATVDLVQQIRSLPPPDPDPLHPLDDPQSGCTKQSPDPPSPSTGKAPPPQAEEAGGNANNSNKNKWTLMMPRINSGRFGVPWDETKQVLQEVLLTNSSANGEVEDIDIDIIIMTHDPTSSAIPDTTRKRQKESEQHKGAKKKANQAPNTLNHWLRNQGS